jgi:hypothetical protein
MTAHDNAPDLILGLSIAATHGPEKKLAMRGLARKIVPPLSRILKPDATDLWPQVDFEHASYWVAAQAGEDADQTN